MSTTNFVQQKIPPNRISAQQSFIAITAASTPMPKPSVHSQWYPN